MALLKYLNRRQMGADTVLSDRHRLVLMDCFETLVQYADGRYIARTGVVVFLEEITKRRRKTVVVISDAAQQVIEAALRESGLWGYVRDVYHAGNSAEDLGHGRMRKRLDLVLTEYQTARDDAVFIGDSPLDAEAAAFHQVPFIRVPRSEDHTFTFVSLLAGPSRYDSGEFSSKLFQTYQVPKA